MTCPACDLGAAATYGEHRESSPDCRYYVRHRHFSIDIPPLFCEQCGKRWSLVVDGRKGRKQRRARVTPEKPRRAVK